MAQKTPDLKQLLADLDAYRAAQDLSSVAGRELGAAAGAIRRALTEIGGDQ